MLYPENPDIQTIYKCRGMLGFVFKIPPTYETITKMYHPSGDNKSKIEEKSGRFPQHTDIFPQHTIIKNVRQKHTIKYKY